MRRLLAAAAACLLLTGCVRPANTEFSQARVPACRYQEVISIEPGRRYRGAVHYLFPGGCVTYRLDFRSAEQARPLGEVLLALGFVARDALRETLREVTAGNVPLDPPARTAGR